MKRILTILLIFGVAVTFFGFRGAGWRGARTVAGDYTFDGITTFGDTIKVDFITPNDSDVVYIGVDGLTETDSIQINEYIKGGFTTTGTQKIDLTTAVADTGMVIEIDSLTGGSDVAHDGIIVRGTGYKDLTQYFIRCYDRTDDLKFYVNAYGNYWGKGNLGANGALTIAGETNLGDAATDTVTCTGIVNFADGLIGSAKIRGTATFTATMKADTVEIVGTGANDFFWIQVKGATVPTSPFTYACQTNTLFVYCAEGDTAVARASGYNWLRLE